jgi:hypothetical protein
LSDLELYGLDRHGRTRRENESIAHAIQHKCGEDCLRCGKIEVQRDVDVISGRTSITARCSSPTACPHAKPTMRYRTVKGLDGRVETIAEPVFNMSPTSFEATWSDHSVDAMRYLSPEDFQSQYMTEPFPAPVDPSPAINRDTPLTDAGDAW